MNWNICIHLIFAQVKMNSHRTQFKSNSKKEAPDDKMLINNNKMSVADVVIAELRQGL